MGTKSLRPRSGTTALTGVRGEATPSNWQLADSNGDHWYYWFDTNGGLRKTDAATFEAAGFNYNTGGHLVGDVIGGTGAGFGQASQMHTLLVKKTGIANNTATPILTVTVPNGNHAAGIRITLLGSLGTGTDTFESSRIAIGTIVLARQTGANVVATAVALTNA